ncbi:MAG TPA: ABC transporter ATP-binding protein [Bacilli bacterium]|nr:ABC transporter ATP-binding protein [Bacilli bacterium]
MNNSEIKSETKDILKASKKDIVYKLVVSILLRVTVFIIPVLWGTAIEYITKSNFNMGYKFLIISIIIVLLYYIFEVLNQEFYYRLYNKFNEMYNDIAIKAITKNSIYSLSRFSSSEYINIIDNDIDVISVYYASLVIRIIRVIEFLVIFVYFWSLNIYIFLFSVITSIVLYIVLVLFGNILIKLNIKSKSNMDSKDTVAHEIFNGIKEIKGFNVSESVRERLNKYSEDYVKSYKKYNMTSYTIKMFVLFCVDVSKYVLAIYGFYLFSQGKMELGTILIMYSYYTNMLSNFDNLATMSIDYKILQVSLIRFNKLLEYRVENYSTRLKKKVDCEGKIVFENVLYGNKEDPILNNVSFTISPNSITIITGKPSSGKSGVFDLLLKLNRKHSGKIFIDDIEMEKIDESTYYQLISSVRREYTFFDISIMENLKLIDDNEEKIYDICKELEIYDYIMNLPEGFDTMIMSTNRKISSDVKNLLAIARVLIRDSKIMLFDDIISILDENTQHKVLNLLKKMKKDHTIVIITREENIIKESDEVIVLDENKLLAENKYSKLTQEEKECVI